MQNRGVLKDDINTALWPLHVKAQTATTEELVLISNEYMEVVNIDDYKNFIIITIGRSFWQLADEDKEDLYQDVSLKMRTKIVSGTLPLISKGSTANYFMRSYYNKLIDFYHKYKHVEDEGMETPRVQKDQYNPEITGSQGSGNKPFDLENLKRAFFTLFFLLKKVDEVHFNYYCAKISYAKDNVCARAAVEGKVLDWETLSQGEKNKIVNEFKYKLKGIEYKACNLFKERIRQRGFTYKNQYFSQQESKSLSKNSTIIKGILWHLYSDFDSLDVDFNLTDLQIGNLKTKLNGKNAVFLENEYARENSVINLRKFISALYLIYAQFDGAIVLVSEGDTAKPIIAEDSRLYALISELNTKAIVNAAFVHGLQSSIAKSIRINI